MSIRCNNDKQFIISHIYKYIFYIENRIKNLIDTIEMFILLAIDF